MKHGYVIRQLVLLGFIGLGTCPLPADTAGDFRFPEGKHGRGELRYFGSVPVLIVRGSHAEMGEQIGVLALKPASKVVKLVDGFADRQISKSMRPMADLAMQALYANFPAEYREELEAMAQAAGVDVKSLVMANTIIDLQELVGCSSLLVAANRSATNGSLYGRNMDLPYVEGLAEHSLLIVYKPNAGHAFAMPNLPGFLMLASGINDAGLALGSQSVGVAQDGSPRFSPTGIASAVAGRRLMEQCVDITTASKWLKENRLTRSVSIAACDPTQQSVFEVTTQRLFIRKSGDGVSCATNHFRTPELARRTECARYSHLDAVRKIDRVGVGEVSESLKKVNQGNMTVHTMIFEPAALRIHLAMGAGPVTDLPLSTINLEELLVNDSTTHSRSDKPSHAPKSVLRSFSNGASTVPTR